MRHPEDVYRSHAEPSLPLFEKFDAPSSQERSGGDLPDLRDHMGYGLDQVIDDDPKPGHPRGASKPFAGERGLPQGTPKCDGGASLTSPAIHVTGLEGASNGAGLHGCGSALQGFAGSTTPNGEGPEIRQRLGDGVKLRTSGEVHPRAHARRTDKQTSHDAAASVRNITPTQKAIRWILLEWDAQTDEQIAEHYYLLHRAAPTIVPKASPSGIRSRRAELVRMGLVCDSGQTAAISTGRMATVWKIVNGGKQ